MLISVKRTSLHALRARNATEVRVRPLRNIKRIRTAAKQVNNET